MFTDSNEREDEAILAAERAKAERKLREGSDSESDDASGESGEDSHGSSESGV